MKQSESIGKLAAALVTVQQHITPVAKDRENTHFKNKYATLDAIMENVRPLLAGHGLAIVQGGGGPVLDINGVICGATVETLLVHTSGEYVSSTIVLPLDRPTPQALGSAITYGRRYGVSAILALTTEDDDDGHVATANASNAPAKAATPAAKAPPASNGSAPACPVCSGPMWDNRATKTKPTQPDFKCKNAPKERGGPGCAGVVWPPKDAPVPAMAGGDEPPLPDEPPF